MFEKFNQVYDIISEVNPETQMVFVCALLDYVASANKVSTPELIDFIRPIVVDVNETLGPVISKWG